jgi:hypothetical protein
MVIRGYTGDISIGRVCDSEKKVLTMYCTM